MSVQACLLWMAVYYASGLAALNHGDPEAGQEVVGHTKVRDIKSKTMTSVSKYWQAYSKRRTEALGRCESRLFLYSNRRKLAEELLINVAKRYSKAELADVKMAQQDTEIKETALRECVQQIAALHGDDSFYREYQHLTTDLQRLKDQVASCLEAGGQVTSSKRNTAAAAADHFDEQVVARLSPQMFRVYNDIKRQTSAQEEEKLSCFSSLAIPANFPVQLEVVKP